MHQPPADVPLHAVVGRAALDGTSIGLASITEASTLAAIEAAGEALASCHLAAQARTA